MNTPAHTPEPWKIQSFDRDPLDKVRSAGGGTVAHCGDPTYHGSTPDVAQANAARIIACVNACAGINPEAVPELVAALEAAEYAEKVCAAASVACPDGQLIPKNVMDDVSAACEKARKLRTAALAKAKGGAS